MTMENTASTPAATKSKVAKTANGLATKADDRISEMTRKAEDAARRAEEALHKGVETLRVKSQAYAEEAVRRMEDTKEAVSDKVRERPLTGLAIAAGVGLLVGLLISPRRH